MHALHITSWAALVPSVDPGWEREIRPAWRRRDPRICQMALVAAARALALPAPSTLNSQPSTPLPPPSSVIVATALGALDETERFLSGIFTTGFGSPAAFVNSVHSSIAGRLAIALGIKGPNLTVSDGPNSLASAIGACEALAGADFPALLVTVDENTALLRRLVPHLSTSCRACYGDAAAEACAAFVVERTGRGPCPRLDARGPEPADDPPGACRRLAAELGRGDYSFVAPPDGPHSPAKAPLIVTSLLRAGAPGRHVIGTFSPSSRSAAVVEVRL